MRSAPCAKSDPKELLYPTAMPWLVECWFQQCHLVDFQEAKLSVQIRDTLQNNMYVLGNGETECCFLKHV